jgi:hypothetical protein
MLSHEEFEASCNRMDAELAAEMARQDAFIASLEKAILELSFQRFPETLQHKHLFIEALTRKAHQNAVILNETLDLVVGGSSSDKFEFYNQNHVPPRDVSQEEKQFLEETLKSLPPEQHAEFIQLNSERISVQNEEREFVFLCYDKAKELLVKYFPEINDFSGNSIRNIDYSAYARMDEWVYDFYYYAGDFMNPNA